jgi:hypothetical protein
MSSARGQPGQRRLARPALVLSGNPFTNNKHDAAGGALCRRAVAVRDRKDAVLGRRELWQRHHARKDQTWRGE